MLRKWVSITLKKKNKNYNGLFHKFLCIYNLTCICHVRLSFDSMLQSVANDRPSFLPKVQPRVTFTTKKKKRILSQLEVNSCKGTSDHYWLQFRDWRTDSNKESVAVTKSCVTCSSRTAKSTNALSDYRCAAVQVAHRVRWKV